MYTQEQMDAAVAAAVSECSTAHAQASYHVVELLRSAKLHVQQGSTQHALTALDIAITALLYPV